MKTYISFKLKLPHENWDEFHAQTSSPTTWQLTSASTSNFLMKTEMSFTFHTQTSSSVRNFRRQAHLSFHVLTEEVWTSNSSWILRESQTTAHPVLLLGFRGDATSIDATVASVETSSRIHVVVFVAVDAVFGLKLNLEEFQVVSVFMLSKSQEQEAALHRPSCSNFSQTARSIPQKEHQQPRSLQLPV
jgi:hypothetical protein